MFCFSYLVWECAHKATTTTAQSVQRANRLVRVAPTQQHAHRASFLSTSSTALAAKHAQTEAIYPQPTIPFASDARTIVCFARWSAEQLYVLIAAMERSFRTVNAVAAAHHQHFRMRYKGDAINVLPPA